MGSRARCGKGFWLPACELPAQLLPAETSRCSVSSCRGWAGTGGFPRLGRGKGGCQLREAELWRHRYASALPVLSDKRCCSQRAPRARPTPSSQSRSCRQQDFSRRTRALLFARGMSPPAPLPPHQPRALMGRRAAGSPQPTLCLSPGPSTHP